jgi:hypothetical protein
VNNPNPNPVVAALPGADWVAVFRNDDGSEYREPLVAWLVRADGEMEPTCVADDGSADDATTAGNFLRLIRPTLGTER